MWLQLTDPFGNAFYVNMANVISIRAGQTGGSLLTTNSPDTKAERGHQVIATQEEPAAIYDKLRR